MLPYGWQTTGRAQYSWQSERIVRPTVLIAASARIRSSC